MTDHTDRHNPIGWTYFGQPHPKEEPPVTKPVISKTPVGDWQIDWPDGNARTVFTWEIAMLYVAAYYQNGMKP